MIELRLPLRNVSLNQPFGANYLDFYKKLGYLGHNGVDLRAYSGFKCYAAHAGDIIIAWTDPSGGIEVDVWDPVNKFKTVYYHLKEYVVKVGDHVQAGQLIGYCDNTGQMTTGNHLHFGMKYTDDDANTINKNNGYGGAVDPTPYFNMSFDGMPIGNKDCFKSNAYHRYYRGRPEGGYQNEVKVIASLTPYLFKHGYKRLPNNEEINACTYGGWDREAVINPAMYINWAYLKKSEYTNGKIAFEN